MPNKPRIKLVAGFWRVAADSRQNGPLYYKAVEFCVTMNQERWTRRLSR